MSEGTVAPAGVHRLKRSVLSSAALVSAKLVAAGTALLAVPILLGYLGPERYGLLMTCVAGAALLALLDQGVPGALIGALAETIAGRDQSRAAGLVSTSLHLLLRGGGLALIAVAGFATTAVLAFSGPEGAWFAMLLLGAGAALGIPAAVVDATWRGLQRGYQASVWQLVSSSSFLALVYLAATTELGLPGAALAYALPPVIAAALSGAHLFCHRAPWLRPRLSGARPELRQQLRERALPLLKLQWAGVINNQSDVLVIAALIGLDRAAEYAIASRLFLPIQGLVALALQPLWPAFAEATALRDSAWAARTLRRIVLAAGGLAIPAVWLAVTGCDAIVARWLGPGVRLSPELVVAFGAWTVLACLSMPFGLYLVGSGVVGRQAGLALSGAFMNLAASVALVPRVGPSGAVWASVVAQGAFLTLPAVMHARRHLAATSRVS